MTSSDECGPNQFCRHSVCLCKGDYHFASDLNDTCVQNSASSEPDSTEILSTELRQFESKVYSELDTVRLHEIRLKEIERRLAEYEESNRAFKSYFTVSVGIVGFALLAIVGFLLAVYRKKIASELSSSVPQTEPPREESFHNNPFYQPNDEAVEQPLVANE